MVIGETMNKKIKRKTTGIIFILSSLIYLLIEYIVIKNTSLNIYEAYVNYSVSHIAMPLNQTYLGITNNFSPQYMLLNIAFIILGIIFIISCILEINKRINSNKILYYPLMIITGVGFIFLGIFSAGQTSINNHQLAIFMSLLCGNIFLILMGKTINTNKIHRNTSLILGIIGTISFIILTYSLINKDMIIYMGLFERISIYTLIIWNIITGTYLLKQ